MQIFWKVGQSEKMKIGRLFSRTVYCVEDIISFITVCPELCTTVSENIVISFIITIVDVKKI